jgi:hypothetical protein
MLGEMDLPGIERIGALQERRVVELEVPGFEAGLTQDLGSHAARILIQGSLHGDTARDELLEALRAMYDAGEPTDFVADIVTATEVHQVLVERLQVEEVADAADSFRYLLWLRQYVPPPEPETGLDLGLEGLPEIDLGIELDALDLLDALELPDLLSVPNLSDPTPPLRGVLDGVSGALSDLDGIAAGMDELFGDS